MTDWSTLKKLIWLRIIKGGGSALRTVTGSLIHITDALALPAKALTVNVEPIQDLHGQASPYPAGGGPNKLPPLTSETKNGVTITVADDGTVTINGEATTDSYFDCDFTTSWSQGDYYHLCAFNPVASTSNRLSIFVITGNGNPQINLNTANAVFSTQASANQTTSRWRLRVPAGVTFSNFIVKPMFQVGGTAPTAYAPYSNICPISGRTSATVTRTGKNLLKNIGVGGTNRGITAVFNDDGTVTLSGTNDGSGYSHFVLNGYFQTENGVEYTMSGAVSSNIILRNVGAGVSDTGNGINFTGTGSSQSIEIRVLANTAISGSVVIKPMIRLASSTDSTYEPYNGNTYTIQLGDTVYGGTLDVTQGKMLVDRAMVDLGTMNWFYNKAYAFFTSSSLANRAIGVTNLKSDLFKTTAGSWSGTPLQNAIWGNGSNATIYVQIPPYDNVADFVQLVAGHQLVYELATPIEITLTPTQIDMLLGENNLWADAGDSTLTYYAEGEASTSEALGILLGGTYNNPGGADDVSDDEALGILLGGS